MQLKLPPPGHPALELFDPSDLERVKSRRGLPTFRQAAEAAARTFGSPDGHMIREVNCIVLRADDSVELVQFGRRGGHRTVWKFF